MRTVKSTAKFRKSLKKVIKSGSYKLENIQEVLDLLEEGNGLPIRFRDHSLTGKLHDHRDCHIYSDLVLIYRLEDKLQTLVFVDIGKHAEVFK